MINNLTEKMIMDRLDYHFHDLDLGIVLTQYTDIHTQCL